MCWTLTDGCSKDVTSLHALPRISVETLRQGRSCLCNDTGHEWIVHSELELRVSICCPAFCSLWLFLLVNGSEMERKNEKRNRNKKDGNFFV